ncbi:MAG: helix-turn-helix transcriptional regulator [Pseudolabrys sp.]
MCTNVCNKLTFIRKILGLTADVIAARHGISPRHMRVLFEAENTSFSDFVIGQRLQRAHRMRINLRLAHQPIKAIAADCGFRDPSHFTQMFRRRYGMTPSDARAKAREL